MVERCHQRLIRDEMSDKEPREAPQSLSGFYVKEIDKSEAKPIILKYEWLGTMPKITRFCYGLFSPEDEIHGVACFGMGNGTLAGNITTAEIAKPICLERGACVHYSHPHAPSFLVANACRKVYEEKGFNVFYAYSDKEAGEIGTIYQACNWYYLGVSPGRASKYRYKYRNLFTGEVLSSRTVRSKVKRGEFHEPAWEKIKDYGKGKYCWFEGSRSEKKKLRSGLRYPALIYPKRVFEN